MHEKPLRRSIVREGENIDLMRGSGFNREEAVSEAGEVGELVVDEAMKHGSHGSFSEGENSVGFLGRHGKELAWVGHFVVPPGPA